MAMAQEQQKKKSATDYANSAINAVQTTRTVVQAAKKIQMAISAISTLVSTAEIWIPALIIGIAILLFVIFIVVIIGQNNSPNQGGQQAMPSAQPGPPPTQGPSEVVYCQGGESWSKQVFDNGTIAKTGCVPTSMAMILSSYGMTQYNPGQVATIFDNNGWTYGPGSGNFGTNPWKINGAWLNSVGFKRAQTDIVNNWRTATILSANQLQQIKNYTDSGWLLLSAVDGHNLPTRVNGGHEVVIENADPQANTITIRDPNDRNCRSGKTVTFNAANVGWFLITPVKINSL